MKGLIFFILVLLCGSCAKQPYSGMDAPSSTKPNTEDAIIAYIDQRLEDEYYWLDEVNQKRSMFNRRLAWNEYLPNALSKLTTNKDDGYYNSNGQRSYYSYIREVATTRSETMGLGILLHYTIVGLGDNRYGFVVESVYPDSPAARAGLRRGDIITEVGNSFITQSNYATNFNNIQSNRVQTLRLSYMRRSEDSEEYSATIESAMYSQTPIAYCDVLNVEGYDKKIGYLSYLGFESEYNDELSAALAQLSSAGIEELILDLRCNGGGSVSSALLLCSAIVPSNYEDKILCAIERNKKNAVAERRTEFKLEGTGNYLNLQRLTVICSENSASASELVIMGLRGMDFPVTLIGATTRGKNCGMDVTRKVINGKELEYAPITFMCFNAKGFGQWGDGIAPDVDLCSKSNKYGIYNESYPLPYTHWGDMQYDIALIVALAEITGKPVSGQSVTRSRVDENIAVVLQMPCPEAGIKLYESER